MESNRIILFFYIATFLTSGGGGDEEEGAPSSGDATARLARAVNQDHFRPCVSLQRRAPEQRCGVDCP